MVGTNKILTVSYGTFSCTLEGFDDSFNTMKAIAEYFRDLAADDRYFGAEPPTPDAEMLARIAEREIARRVEARLDKDGVVLRPAIDSPEGAEAPRGDTSGAAIAAAVATTARTAAPSAEVEPAQTDTTDMDAPAAEEPVAEVVEATIPEIAEASPDAADNGDAGSGDVEEDQSSDDVLATSDPAVDHVEDAPAVNEDPVPAAAVAEPAPVAAPDATPVATSEPDADSLAAKLQRIRAVVGSAQRPAAEGSDGDDLTESFFDDSDTPDVADVAYTAESEDDAPAAEDFDTGYEDDGDLAPQSEPAETADAEVEAETPQAEADQEQDTPAPADAAGPSDMISRVLARHGATAAADTAEDNSAEAEAEAEAEAAAETVAEEPARPAARVIRVRRPGPVAEAVAAATKEEPSSEVTDATEEEKADASFDLPSVADLDGADELDSYLVNEDDDFSAEEDAEMLRAIDGEDMDADLDDLDVMDGSAEDADDSEDDATIGDVLRLGEDTRVDPDANTAEPTTDSAAEDSAAEDSAEDNSAEQEAPAPRSGRAALLASEIEENDDDLNRLLEEADAQMQEPEGSRRRSAIAQLKAAVAATEAARRAGEPEENATEEAENAFRSDLDEVVRPRRAPRPAAARTERPRPAPLKLVASQRVDVPAATAEKPATPVRPRRIERNADADAGSFAQFAEKVNARELPELLEAAAAYTSFVEGAEEFSRPQIMRRVRAVQADDFNREDGLRTFADLIRQGRFTKVSHGRFQVAEDTPFHPERRAG